MIDIGPPPTLWLPPKPAIIRAASLKEATFPFPTFSAAVPMFARTPTLAASLFQALSNGSTSTNFNMSNPLIPAGSSVWCGVMLNSTTGSSVGTGLTVSGNGLTAQAQIMVGGTTEVTLCGRNGGILVDIAANTSIQVGTNPVPPTGANGFLVMAWMSGTVTLDKAATASGSSVASVTATTAALANPAELIIGFMGQASSAAAYSGAAGFTNLFAGGTWTQAFGYKRVGGTAAQSYTPTLAAATTRMGACVATYY